MVTHMNRLIREVALTYTQEEADAFNPSIAPESLPFILSSVVPMAGVGTYPRAIKRYYISGTQSVHHGTSGPQTAPSGTQSVHHGVSGTVVGDEPGPLQIYQGAYIYPYCGVNTMFAHVEVVFDEIPIPHESVLKWCSLALRAGPVSASARANQLVVVKGNHLHYLWRVLSVEAERELPTTRSLDITNLHLWRWHVPQGDLRSPDWKGDLRSPDWEEGGIGRWVCGRVSLDVDRYTLTTSRGARTIDWDAHTATVPDDEPIHKLYFSLLAESLL